MIAPVETIQVKRDEAGLRLDRWFKLHFPDVAYGYLQKLLRSGQVRVDSKRVAGQSAARGRPAGARAERRSARRPQGALVGRQAAARVCPRPIARSSRA